MDLSVKDIEKLSFFSEIAPVRSIKSFILNFNPGDGLVQQVTRVFRASKPAIVTFDPFIDTDPNVLLPNLRRILLSTSSSNLTNDNSIIMYRYIWNPRTFIVPRGQSWFAAPTNASARLTVIERSFTASIG